VSRRSLLVVTMVAGIACGLAVTGLGSAEGAEPALFSDGFESGSTSAWTSSTGLTVQNSVVGEGTWAARAVMSGGAAYATKTLASTTATAKVALRLNVQAQTGTTAVNFVKVRTATGTAIAEVFVTPTLVLGLRNDVTAKSTNSPVVVSTGTWHDIALTVTVNGTSSTTKVSYDGQDVPALSLVHDLGTAPVGRVQVGENVAGRTADLVYDLVTVTDPNSNPSPSATPSPSDSPSPSPSISPSPSDSPSPSPSISPSPSDSPSPSPSPLPTYPVLAAAGDIACDPLKVNYNGGLGKGGECAMRAVSDAILADSSITAVAALGDVQYECGGLQAFNVSYDPTWGRFKARTRPAIGNHEYIASSTTTPATDCDATGRAAGYFTYYGALAGDPTKGYYSYDLGTWHVVVLNSQCGSVGGCGKGSPQEVWLKNDLAAHTQVCTLAYYHIPLWSSGGRANQNSKAFVDDLVAARAEVVLAGHDHTYERFAPMNGSGALDPNGVRSFVVGTGGANHTSFVTTAANSEARDDKTYGYLKLTLKDGSYDWKFVPVGGTFTDSGTGTCR